MKRYLWVIFAVAATIVTSIYYLWFKRCNRCAPPPSDFAIHGVGPLKQAQDEIIRRQSGSKTLSPFGRYLEKQRISTSELIAAVERVRSIYGNDNQIEPARSLFLPSPIRTNLAATAAIIPCTYFEPGCDSDAAEYRLIKVLPAKDLCCDVRFADQIAPAVCTAFLISPDAVATARHCLFIGSDDKYYVFDFAAGFFGSVPKTFIHGVNLFKAKPPLRMSCPQTDDDWAIIPLDGQVDRPHITFGDGHPQVDAPLYAAGFPLGHPIKFVPGAAVRSNDRPEFFVTNLDGFKGSSGSPVFDARTNKVEGIWVRGEQTLIQFHCDAAKKCFLPLVCPQGGGRGEDVTRISLLQGGNAPDCANPIESNPPPGPAEEVVCDGRRLSEVIAEFH